MYFEMSVVIATIGRLTLLRAVKSIFDQKFEAKIQILIGIDIDQYGNINNIKRLLTEICPANVSITWIEVGYSTSKRHGGVHKCFYGGSLRTALSFLAQSKYVMYLDDDDWIADHHCNDVLKAIENKKWAFALSFYADGNLCEPICVDGLESVGVNVGCYKDTLGGFVRPSGLLVNKLELAPMLHLWSESPFPSGDGEDRLIFSQLKNQEHGFTNRASVYASIDPQDGMHSTRLEYIKSQGKTFKSDKKNESSR